MSADERTHVLVTKKEWATFRFMAEQVEAECYKLDAAVFELRRKITRLVQLTDAHQRASERISTEAPPGVPLP